MARTLGVWMDGVRVAELRDGTGDSIRCAYTEEALELWPRNSPLVQALEEDTIPADSAVAALVRSRAAAFLT